MSATSIFGNVPPRNPDFTGRTDFLRELERRLSHGTTEAALPEVLHGMGGVGKSQLATEYAYRHRSDFDVIWWIPAERSVKIVASLVELGTRLGLNIGDAYIGVQEVVDALRGGRHPNVPPNWFLVFDNADSPAAVQQYLPTGGSGRILVTSRNSQWLSVSRSLELAVFRRSESVRLLRRRAPDLTEQDAGGLAEALGDLPLAIAQAAAWSVETGMAAREYLELLQEKQLELLDSTTTLDYPLSVAGMCDLSLTELRRENPSALKLLQVCAFLAPEPIPRTVFANGRDADVDPELSEVLRDRLKLNEAIRDINRFALARIDHRTDSVEVHRLVGTVLVGRMSDGERERMRRAARLILAAGEAHAAAHASEREGGMQATTWPRTASEPATVPDHPAALAVALDVAGALRASGDVRTACRMDVETLERATAALGADHPTTLAAAVALADDFRALGDVRTAYRMDVETLERVTAVLRAPDRDDGAESARREAVEALRSRLVADHPAALPRANGDPVPE